MDEPYFRLQRMIGKYLYNLVFYRSLFFTPPDSWNFLVRCAVFIIITMFGRDHPSFSTPKFRSLMAPFCIRIFPFDIHSSRTWMRVVADNDASQQEPDLFAFEVQLPIRFIRIIFPWLWIVDFPHDIRLQTASGHFRKYRDYRFPFPSFFLISGIKKSQIPS